MGDKSYKLTRLSPVPAIRFLAATLLGLLILLIATIGSASETDLDSPVSTPPTSSAPALADENAARATPNQAEQRPLTRAAAKQFVETISPVEWLGRFGRVEVGQRP